MKIDNSNKIQVTLTFLRSKGFMERGKDKKKSGCLKMVKVVKRKRSEKSLTVVKNYLCEQVFGVALCGWGWGEGEGHHAAQLLQ